MGELLELTRNARAIAWLIVLVALAGSAWRDLSGRERRPDDAIWALFWFFAISVLGYNARWFAGIPPPPSGEIDFQTRIALNVFLTLIAGGVLWKRYVREGWRW